MNVERYIPFPGGDIRPRPTILTAISYRYGVLDIGLRCAVPETYVHLVFDHPLVFRVSDEGDRLQSLSRSEGLKDFTILRAENSQLKSWIIAESDGVQDCAELEHYAILTIDEWIDVLAWEKPTVVNSIE